MPKELKPCFLCGRICYTERHHIFGGTANRRLSEEDGLVVNLCPDCHNRPPNGAHFNKKTMERLHVAGQARWEMQYILCNNVTGEEAREAFMRRYGKNYIYE